MKKIFALMMVVTILGAVIAARIGTSGDQRAEPPKAEALIDGGIEAPESPDEPGDVTDPKILEEFAKKHSHSGGLQTALNALDKVPDEPTVRGSAKIVGRWGRNMGIVAEAKSKKIAQEYIDLNYFEYVFNLDGTFTDDGRYFGDIWRHSGYYRVSDDGKKLRLTVTRRFENGRWIDVVPDDATYDLYVDRLGFTSFDNVSAHMCQGLWWEKTMGCYVDLHGNRYAEYPLVEEASKTYVDPAWREGDKINSQITAALKAEGRDRDFSIFYNVRTGGYSIHLIAAVFTSKAKAQAIAWLKSSDFYRGGEIYCDGDD